MMKTIRLIAVSVAALLALLSLSSAAHASAVDSTNTRAVAAAATVDNTARTQVQICDIAEWPFEVTCELLNSNDPRLEVDVYVQTPIGKEKIAEWTFRASGKECVSALGYEFCLDVEFDWDEGCVTAEATIDDNVIWGPETWCW